VYRGSLVEFLNSTANVNFWSVMCKNYKRLF
jgi:hypothetical protein